MKRTATILIAAIALVLCGGWKTPAPEVRVPIIMYHSVSRGAAGRYVISPDTLIADLESLEKLGYKTISTRELIDYASGSGSLPDKPIMLTFDDGHYNFLSLALPIIREYGCKAVVGIVGRYAEREADEKKRSDYFSYLSPEELTAVAAHKNIELQNHSYRLHGGRGALPCSFETYPVYAARLKSDLDSCDKLLRECGGSPTAFVCPFGKYNALSVRAIREYGYKAMFTCAEGVNIIKPGDTDALFRLKRFNRPYGIDSAAFFAKLK